MASAVLLALGLLLTAFLLALSDTMGIMKLWARADIDYTPSAAMLVAQRHVATSQRQRRGRKVN
jgi:hypothetical protein